MAYIIEYEGPSAVDNIEGLVHFKVPMNRNAHAGENLLGSHRQCTGTPARIHFDEDIASTLDKMLALVGTEHISAWGPGLHLSFGGSECLSNAEPRQAKCKSASASIGFAHVLSPWSCVTSRER